MLVSVEPLCTEDAHAIADAANEAARSTLPVSRSIVGGNDLP